MPFNGTGTFSPLYVFVNDAANGIKILASRQDGQWNDACTNGLSFCITKDGQQTATQQIPFAQGIKVTNGAAADIVNFGSLGTIRNSFNASVAASGTLTLDTGAGSGGWAGILVVTSYRASDANHRTQTQYGISARGSTVDGSTSLNTANGGSGGMSFSLSYSSGVITVTNGDANSAYMSLTWMGTNNS